MELTSTAVLLFFLIFWTVLYIINHNKDKLGINLDLKTYMGIFGILRTQVGMNIIKKLGKYKLWQKLAYLSIPVCVVISIYTFYAFILSTVGLFDGTVEKEAAKPIIFLFGSTIPWIPGILAIIIGVTIHELSHGIVAASFGQKIKSSGLLLALGIPMGAFVELGDEFKDSKPKIRGAIAAAGPISNVLVFFLVLFAMPYFTGMDSKLTITDVLEDTPAYGIIFEGDVIYSINGKMVNSLNDFYDAVGDIQPEQSVELVVLRNNEVNSYYITTSEEGKMGIVSEPSKTVMYILQTLYWTSLLNMLLGFFNLLPAAPLDGYHIWMALPDAIRDFRKNNWFVSKIANLVGWVISERNLNSISIFVWLAILASMIYSFI
ncbi:site-2 protease family protein [Methanococcus maripaludis]|uniref:Membrane-associated protease RseP (Regulator of RpoE activity) n=1 Tax=Methanococcus maripaludis TaxID=39152 RepID=A0A8T4CMX8_METMI|nr:site-2 protease family protein [Methanococcus maripaludis]MBM7409911.1 membrane-associated protease RseP (regulator of RpoE activity) [Methanococcus maripaludis]MBP2219241.1 membrane-associated protease RseP (regulator of RpoE activity) [Methanococcus maripaludis]